MVVISESVHPSSLDFANQRKVVILRQATKPGSKKMAWPDIAMQVVNLKGGRPSSWLVRRIYKQFSHKVGRRVYQYKRCGRKKWKVTKDVEQFLTHQ